MPLTFQCRQGLLSSSEISRNQAQIIRVSDDNLSRQYGAQSSNYAQFLRQKKDYEAQRKQNPNIILPSEPVKFKLKPLPSQTQLFPNGWALGFDDIKQGALGECFFDAAAMSIANQNPRAILSNLYDNGDTVFVKFYGQNRNDVYIYEIDKSVLEGSRLFINYNFNHHQPWAAILEKAYAIHRKHLLKIQTGLDVPITSFLNGGHTSLVYQSILGNGDAVEVSPYDAVNPDKPTFKLYAIKLFNELIIENEEQINKEKEIIAQSVDIPFDANEYPQLQELTKAFHKLLSQSITTSKDFDDTVSSINQFFVLHHEMKQLAEMQDADPRTIEMAKKLNQTMEYITATAPALIDIFYKIKPYMPDSQNSKSEDFEYASTENFESKAYTSAVGLDLQKRMNQGEILSIATKADFGKSSGFIHAESRESGMVSKHAYQLLSVHDDTSGNKQFTVANPWLSEAGEYNIQGKLQLRDRQEKVHKRAFDHIQTKKDGKKVRNTINLGHLPTDYVQGKDSDYSGVTTIREYDFGRYFTSLYFGKPEDTLVLLNAIQNLIQCSILRLGVENPKIAEAARNIWDSLQFREEPHQTLARINKQLRDVFFESEIEIKSDGDQLIYQIYQAMLKPSFELRMNNIAKINTHLQKEFPDIGVLEAIDQFICQVKGSGLDLPQTLQTISVLESKLGKHDYFNTLTPESRLFFYSILDSMYQNLNSDLARSVLDIRHEALLDHLFNIKLRLLPLENKHKLHLPQDIDPEIAKIESEAPKQQSGRRNRPAYAQKFASDMTLYLMQITSFEDKLPEKDISMHNKILVLKEHLQKLTAPLNEVEKIQLQSVLQGAEMLTKSGSSSSSLHDDIDKINAHLSQLIEQQSIRKEAPKSIAELRQTSVSVATSQCPSSPPALMMEASEEKGNSNLIEKGL